MCLEFAAFRAIFQTWLSPSKWSHKKRSACRAADVLYWWKNSSPAWQVKQIQPWNALTWTKFANGVRPCVPARPASSTALKGSGKCEPPCGKTYRFADEALAEFIAAGRYYNGQVAELGNAFVDEIERGIGIILAGPTIWRIIEEDVRRYLVRRFPYGIYYTIEGDVIAVWAVKHLHRDPDYWQQRRG